MRAMLSIVCMGVFASILPVQAQDDANEAEAVQAKEAKPSRWSISGGAMIRTVDAKMHVPAPSFDWRNHVRRMGPTGMGKKGLFSNPDGSFLPIHPYFGPGIQYENGSVGSFSVTAGLDDLGLTLADRELSVATVKYDDGSQVESVFGIDPLGFDVDFGYVTFNTHEASYSYDAMGSFGDLYGSDEEDGVGPYLQLRYMMHEQEKFVVNALVGAGILETDHSTSGALGAMTVMGSMKRTDYGYRYAGVFSEASGELLEPITGDDSARGLVLVDPSPLDEPLPLLPGLILNPILDPIHEALSPQMGSQMTGGRAPVAQFMAYGSSDLDVTLTEIAFGVEVLSQPWKNVHCGLAVGPTINIINGDFDASTVVMDQNGTTVAAENYHSDTEEIEVGAMARVNLLINLGENDKFFIEGGAGYNWVDDVTFRAGPAEAEVDVSSFAGNVGVGIRL